MTALFILRRAAVATIYLGILLGCYYIGTKLPYVGLAASAELKPGCVTRPTVEAEAAKNGVQRFRTISDITEVARGVVALFELSPPPDETAKDKLLAARSFDLYHVVGLGAYAVIYDGDDQACLFIEMPPELYEVWLSLVVMKTGEKI